MRTARTIVSGVSCCRATCRDNRWQSGQHGRVRRVVILVMAAGLAVACSTASADTAQPMVVDDAASTTTPEPSADDVGRSGSTTTTAVPSTTAATTTAAPSSTLVAAPTSDAVDEAAREDDPDLALIEDVEPVFDIGLGVELDVDAARFPVDDAGVGGPVGGGGAGADDTGQLTGASALTGWAGFNASLEAALIRPGNTAAAVAVMIDGDLVNAAAFGVRDPARGDAAQPSDRFRIASISKPITAIVALELVEQGLVGLDEPIGELIAEHVGAESISVGGRQLTLRRLLNHTTGFGRYYSTFFQLGADDCPDAARQGLARAGGGGGYSYSNMNYCLAGMLIEAVTGESLDRATYRSLLTPLGISGMRLAPTFDPGPGEVQHRTTPGRAYMETLGGAGSWVASPIDLVRIMNAVDPSTSGFKALDELTVLAMLTPTGGTLGQRGYGLGVISYGGGRVGHTGTIEATHAMVLNRGDGVIWAVTVAGDWPSESERLEQLVNDAFVAGGFVAS